MAETYTYILLLRAINIGGHVVKMEDLRRAFTDAGFNGVKTYIQTGNVIFESTEANTAKLTKQVETMLKAALGYETKVFIFTVDQLQKAASKNPFDPERLDKEQHCHLMFLADEPSQERVDTLMAMAAPEYRFHVDGKVLYYAYSRAYEGRNRRPINFEKVLDSSGTARTWKVVNKLTELVRT